MENSPREKVIPGTTFTVDCFQSKYLSTATTAHFLSHAHADHYQGLSERWDAGPIYCSEVTGVLAAHILGIDRRHINTLPMNTPVEVQGVHVTLVSANHCPGAVQFCFELPCGDRFLHCGDARYCTEMQRNQVLQRFVGCRAVFLDTTYCNPKYAFPLQDVAVQYIADTIHRLLNDGSGQRRAFIISTYVIGKERILLEVHRRCRIKIHVSHKKMAVLRCLALTGDLDAIFTMDASETPVSVADWGFLGDTFPFFRPNFRNCEEHRSKTNVDKVVAFVPTGWMYEFKKERNRGFPVREKDNCQIHLVPYSEHSSYEELREYVQFLRPQQVVPTVGCNGDRAVDKMLSHFRHLVDETAAKTRFLAAFCPESAQGRFSVSAKQISDHQPAGDRSCQSVSPTALATTHSFPLPALLEDRAGIPSNHGSGNEEGDHKPARIGAVDCVAKGGPGSSGCTLLATASDTELDVGGNFQLVMLDARGRKAAAVRAQAAAKAAAVRFAQGLGGHQGRNLGSCREANTTDSPHLSERMIAECTPAQAPSAVDSAPTGEPLEPTLEPAAVCDSALDADSDARVPTGVAQESATLQDQLPAWTSPVTVACQNSTEKWDADSVATANRSSSLAAGPASADSAPYAADSAPYAATGSSTCERDGERVAGSGLQAVPCSHSGGCSGSDALLDELLSILGPNMEVSQAEDLLQRAKRDVATAVNFHFEGGSSRPGSSYGVASATPTTKRRIGSLLTSSALKRKKGNAKTTVISTTSIKSNTRALPKNGSKAPDLGQQAITSFFAAPLRSSRPFDNDRPPAHNTPALDNTPALALSTQPKQKLCVPSLQLTTQSRTPGNPGCKTAVSASNGTAVGRPSGLAFPLLPAPKRRVSVAAVPTVDPPSHLSQPPALSKQQVTKEHQSLSAADEGGKTNAAIDHPKTAEEAVPSASQTPARVQSAAQVAPGRAAELPSPAVTATADATLKSIRDYRPVNDAGWTMGNPAPYLHLAQALTAMDGTTKRLIIADVACNMFRSLLALSPEDVLPACYLALGKLAPDFEGVDLRVGGSTIAAAISEATGVSRIQLSRLHDTLGDLGDVAEQCRIKQSMLIKPAALTVAGVFEALHIISGAKGQGSTQRKQAVMKHLISRCRGVETKYLVRTLVQNLRVGANWRSVVGSLARAVLLHREGSSQSKTAQDVAAAAALEAFHLCPSLDVLVPALVEGGPGDLQRRCSLRPGVPLLPMAAKICEGIPDAIAMLRSDNGRFLAEFKYDGFRAQIHMLSDASVRVFSRNCEDRTASYPDVGNALRSAAAGGATTMVLDAEVVAVDRSSPGGAPGGGTVLKSFQELSTRSRGTVAAAQVDIPVCIFVFDALFADGDILTALPLRARRRRLTQMLPNLRPGFCEMAQSIEVGMRAHNAAAISAPDSVPTCSAPSSAGAHPTGAHPTEAHPTVVPLPMASLPRSEALTGAALEPKSVTSADVSKELIAAQQQQQQQQPLGSGGTCEATVLEADNPGDSDHRDKPSNMPGAVAADLAMGLRRGGDDFPPDTEADQEAHAVATEVQEFLLHSFAAGTEGLMLKRLDGNAAYQPSKRSESWIKIKRDYCEGLRDSLDLVPIGGWWGNGRKAGWVSPFLLAAWDPESETFSSVCRCMSGFSDVFYAEATQRLMEKRLPGPKQYYVTGESPQLWFEPSEVWEIRGAELTLSPVHKAAAGRMHPERGVSLRFPRYIQTRSDKGVEQSTGPDVLEDLYIKQSRRMKTAQEKLAATAGQD